MHACVMEAEAGGGGAFSERTSTIFGNRMLQLPPSERLCLCVVLLSVGTSFCVYVSVSESDYIMVPASEDAANERVCLRHCALFCSGYRDAPVTEYHGNRKWAGHLAHQ